MTKGRVDLTVFADASWNQKTKCGGWGCWIKDQTAFPAVIRGGPLKGAQRSSNVCELKAIANALALAARTGMVKGRVMVQSDCIHALYVIRRATGAIDNPVKGGEKVAVNLRKKWKRWPDEEQIVASIKLSLATAASVEVRHVRGHKAGNGRAWVNRECDRLALAGRLVAEGETLGQ